MATTGNRNFVCRVYYTSIGGAERFTDSVRLTGSAARDVADRYGRMGHTAVVVPAPADAAESIEWLEAREVRATWRATWKGQENMTMTTISGVCPGCGRIGVSITDGRTAAHRTMAGSECNGQAAASAPRAAFVPRCTCANAGTCRACKVADGLVQAFLALRSPARMQIGAPLVDADDAAREWAVESPTRTDALAVAPMAQMAAADRAERAAQPAPVIVRPSPRIAKMARQVDAPAFLAAMNMEVVTGIVSAFLAIREAYAAREAKEWAAELSRATRAAQAASAPAKRSGLKCTRCRKATDKCYMNGATVWCVKCRTEVSGITKTAESGKAWAV